MARILIAEDDGHIASFLKKGLRASGFTPSVVTDGHAAASARDSEFDLMILDLGLPGRDGLDALSELRERGERLPVIILTARDAVRHRVHGLELGADDYVTKPFSLEELIARIRVQLRNDRGAETTVLRVDDIELDLHTRRVRVGEQWAELTAREFALTETFLRHAGQVLSREQLLSHVWGYDFDPESNVVEVYVRYLRKKLGEDRIETVRGMGYRLRESPRSTGRKQRAAS
jgi:DNA-binding response OmpR family regulator